MDNGAARAFPAVVIGGSAGAVEALLTIVAHFPADFEAAVFVVIHVPASSVSGLPHLVARNSSLFATHAIDRAPIAPRRIIIAAPDHHLFIEDGVMRSVRGPLENNHRPSIDVLFRSAAAQFTSSACGVLLSGTLDDGVSGLIAIHEAGGGTFAQDPDDAQFADMPSNAIRTGTIDGVYPAQELVDAIRAWMAAPAAPHSAPPLLDERKTGIPSVFTCPDCGGTLWEADQGAVLRFRCRTGHAYSGNSMLSSQGERLEAALWASLRALEERRDLLRRLIRRFEQGDESPMLRRFQRQHTKVESDLERVRLAVGNFSAQDSPS